MATKEFWIQLENRPWDACPNNIDRMHGRKIKDIPGEAPPVEVTLTSPETGAERKNVKMYLPVNKGKLNPDTGLPEYQVTDALILRRYKPPQKKDKSDAWTIPDDRKVNPWDLNEPDPTDSGTMGTIPGPTIECNVGDKVLVHFRNKDNRPLRKGFEITIPLPFPPFEIKFTLPDVPLPVEERTHSLHPHGIVFSPIYDGAYPLSPPDPTQPVGSEAPLWAAVGGFTGELKMGDRVPPGGTFTYTWDTLSWPTTAGVWHYHDHSICDVENVILGAVGFLVIHNPEDPDDVIDQDLPGGEPNGSLVQLKCFPFPFPIPILPHDLEGTIPAPLGPVAEEKKPEKKDKYAKESEGAQIDLAPFAVKRQNLILRPDKDFRRFVQFCLRFYIDPPRQAQYLQYYHELPGVDVCINGRKYMGNTPTLIAGLETKMRFGLAAMNMHVFHTFHLHGHRWVIPGPVGTTPSDIQNSPQIQAVSQFEDTKTFGPANSFSFTINQGSFMGSVKPPQAPGLGEWHMHCHVLGHMMAPGGMMASLLTIEGGGFAFPLPEGVPCHKPEPEVEPPPPNGPAMTATVEGGTGSCTWTDIASGTPETTIKVGGTVTWKTVPGCGGHTVVSDNVPPFDTLVPPLALTEAQLASAAGGSHPFTTVGDFGYHCGIHGGNPASEDGMYGIIHVVP